ncbi:MAG TPA: hypothetical protein VLT62_12005 [Candidatus Methylomirabilis sp.]|nr:hypothetical protein [Candidatus Methylomirabilis sp.]
MPESKTQETLEWARRLLAIGFFLIVAAVVIGVATGSRAVAMYVAAAGLLPIAVGRVAILLQALAKLRGRRRPLATGDSGGGS